MAYFSAPPSLQCLQPQFRQAVVAVQERVRVSKASVKGILGSIILNCGILFLRERKSHLFFCDWKISYCHFSIVICCHSSALLMARAGFTTGKVQEERGMGRVQGTVLSSFMFLFPSPFFWHFPRPFPLHPSSCSDFSIGILASIHTNHNTCCLNLKVECYYYFEPVTYFINGLHNLNIDYQSLNLMAPDISGK